MSKLPKSFYLREDVIQIAQDLLGKYLFTNVDNQLTGGMIIEVEAYQAPEDKASHAHDNRRTKRTETMFAEGGIAYVYLCYGIHSLFNVITNQADIPHAILIRAIQPLEGIEIMLERRKKKKLDKTLTSGPGSLSQALGINCSHDATDLAGNLIWIEDRNVKVKPNQILATPRIGIDYAEEYVSKPWRFVLSM